MDQMTVEHQPSAAKLDVLGVDDWPIWEKDISTFPWTYDAPETCYLLRGEVVVTPDGGAPVSLQRGDYVTFPAGMSCLWEIKQAVKKHYKLG